MLAFEDLSIQHPNPAVMPAICYYVSCGGLNDNDPPQAHIFEYLVSNWQNCLGRIRKCDLVRGGVLSDGGLRGFKSS